MASLPALRGQPARAPLVADHLELRRVERELDASRAVHLLTLPNLLDPGEIKNMQGWKIRARAGSLTATGPFAWIDQTTY